MIALGGPKLKPLSVRSLIACLSVSMIALGGPKLKHFLGVSLYKAKMSFNDSTGWA